MNKEEEDEEDTRAKCARACMHTYMHTCTHAHTRTHALTCARPFSSFPAPPSPVRSKPWTEYASTVSKLIYTLSSIDHASAKLQNCADMCEASN